MLRAQKRKAVPRRTKSEVRQEYDTFFANNNGLVEDPGLKDVVKCVPCGWKGPCHGHACNAIRNITLSEMGEGIRQAFEQVVSRYCTEVLNNEVMQRGIAASRCMAPPGHVAVPSM